MPTIKVKEDTCKDTMEVIQYGLLVDEYTCTMPKGHEGFHVGVNKTFNTVTWSNASMIRSRVENEYQDLPK